MLLLHDIRGEEMDRIGLMLLIIVLLMVTVSFHVALMLDFFRPSIVQAQLFGILILLFGGVVLLAFDEAGGYGFAIGCVGLLSGMLSSFRDTSPPETKH